MAYLERAKEFYAPPPVGSPYSVPLPGSEQTGRSRVYRHWRFQGELLKTLDPNVKMQHGIYGSRKATRLTPPAGHYSTSNV